LFTSFFCQIFFKASARFQFFVFLFQFQFFQFG
jgi:hypothetical protein